MVEPDLAARRLLCAAMAYYALDDPLIEDSEYDDLSEFVSQGWEGIEPIRQWQLGSAEEVLASGYHFKITRLTADATVAWMETKRADLKPLGSSPYVVFHTEPWRRSKELNLDWLPVTSFRRNY